MFRGKGLFQSSPHAFYFLFIYILTAIPSISIPSLMAVRMLPLAHGYSPNGEGCVKEKRTF